MKELCHLKEKRRIKTENALLPLLSNNQSSRIRLDNERKAFVPWNHNLVLVIKFKQNTNDLRRNEFNFEKTKYP